MGYEMHDVSGCLHSYRKKKVCVFNGPQSRHSLLLLDKHGSLSLLCQHTHLSLHFLSLISFSSSFLLSFLFPPVWLGALLYSPPLFASPAFLFFHFCCSSFTPLPHPLYFLFSPHLILSSPLPLLSYFYLLSHLSLSHLSFISHPLLFTILSFLCVLLSSFFPFLLLLLSSPPLVVSSSVIVFLPLCHLFSFFLSFPYLLTSCFPSFSFPFSPFYLVLFPLLFSLISLSSHLSFCIISSV